MKKAKLRGLLVAVLVLCMSFALPGIDASAVTVGDFTVGSDIGSVRLYQSDSLSKCTFSSGKIPDGLQLSYTPNDGVFIKGTPKVSGYFTFICEVTTADGTEKIDVDVYVVEAESEDIPANTPVPVATEKPKPSGTAPKITKHPTGETVEPGDSAKFISRADNATKHTWRLVSADTTCTYKASEADYYFPGLKLSGIDTDTLVLSNIPESLSGWCVECKFENEYGASYSNGARITVKSSKPESTPKPTATAKPADKGSDSNADDKGSDKPEATPAVTGSGKTANITTHPQSAQVKKGESVTLAAYATSPNNGDVSYQWYSAPVDDRSQAVAISGATGETYTVQPTEATVYYWAAVYNTKEGVMSEPVYTQAAAVSTIPDPTPTPSPTPSPAPVDDGSDFMSGNFQLILFSVIGLLALAALIGVVIYLRIESKREDE